MSKMFFLYLIFPVIMAALFFLSKDLSLPETMEETGISRAYLKMSLIIYNKIRGRIKSLSGEKIRLYLGSLNQIKDLESAETEYFIRKISIVLLMATAGSFLSIMACISAGNSGNITEGSLIERGEFGEREKTLRLVARDEEGNELMEQSFPVRNRKCTKAEAEVLFEEASLELEKILLNGNESFDCITGDMNFAEAIPGYPFSVSYRADNYEVLHLDGSLNEESIPENGVLVSITATYSYEDYRWQQDFCANVIPRVLSPGERVIRDLKELLRNADESSLTEKTITLPDDYGGSSIVWMERIEDNSFLLLMLMLIGGAASYVMKDKELKKAVEQRENQMLSDYPQFVSELVLYMGAGMTVRNIFQKLSSDYVKKRKNGAEKRYLYEELLRSAREISAGESECDVYEHLGIRCGGKQYTRLVTLLSQNLRKGNGELLALLQEESKKAFDERMDKARKAGEEAGTKLLLPMIIMLVIVMIVIMIPAYMAF